MPTDQQFRQFQHVEVSTRPAEPGPYMRDAAGLWGFDFNEWRPARISTLPYGPGGHYAVQFEPADAHWSFSEHEIRPCSNLAAAERAWIAHPRFALEREKLETVAYGVNPTVDLEGTRILLTERVGYRPVQDRPMACRSYGQHPDGSCGYGCKCGECDGRSVEHVGTVERVVFWADAAVDVVVRCDDGEVRTEQLRVGHLDPC